MALKAGKPALNLAKSIAAVIDKSCRDWNAQDYRGLHDTWDAREPEPWIIAEDVEAPMIGWAVIEAYWQASLGLAERDQLQYANLQVKRLGADLATNLALAIYTLRFVRKVSGPQLPAEGECRVTAVFRQRDQAWRFCHLAEAPLAPFIALRRDFESKAGAAPKLTSPKK